MRADVGVLGGGITGLALGRFLGEGAEVIEAAERPGGLLRTFGRNGFWSDVGGHILFSKDEAVLGAMVGALGENVARRRRNNKVLYEGILVKYPFENGLGALPKEVAYDCLLSFVKNEAPPPPHPHFEAWMRYTLGRAITERYLLPYNRKIWKREPAEMGIEWVERVPRPPIEDVLKSALGIETEGYTHQLHFFYPREGGIEALARAFAEPLARAGRLVTGERVERIRRTDHGWIVDDEREYRELVSTLPMDVLLAALGDAPAEVREAAAGLRSNALAVVMLGIGRREGLDELTAIYVPDPRACFHRVCFNNAFSPWMAPEGAASIQCEITGNPGDGVLDLDDDALGAKVHRELCALGILREDDVVVERMVHREARAYVVPDLGAVGRARRVVDYLASRGIHAAGRFAEHSYLNMDGCVRRAMDVARAIRGEAS